MSSTDRDRIILKIEGLWAKAHGTTNTAEREAFIDGATRLMTKYAIAESDLTERSDREHPESVTWVYTTGGIHLEGRRVMLSIAADIAGSGTTVGYYPDPDPEGNHWCLLVGYPTEIAAAKALYSTLYTHALHAAWQTGLTHPKLVDQFMVGYGFTVTNRVRDAREAAEHESRSEPGAALVPVDRTSDVAKLVESLDAVRTPFDFQDGAATRAGMRAGEQAAIGHQEITP